jgi:hypothetical protein
MKIYLCIVTTLITICLGGMFFMQLEARSERRAIKAEVEHQTKIEQEQKDIKTAYDTAKLLSRIDALEKQGLMSPAQAQESRDELTGKVKLYVDPDGNVTTNPGSKIWVPN